MISIFHDKEKRRKWGENGLKRRFLFAAGKSQKHSRKSISFGNRGGIEIIKREKRPRNIQISVISAKENISFLRKVNAPGRREKKTFAGKDEKRR